MTDLTSNICQIIIFDEQCNASNYGVNTYVSQILDIFKNHVHIKLFHVVLFSSIKEVTFMRVNENTYMIKIPHYNGEKDEAHTIYFKNTIYLLRQYIDEKVHTIFHFNFLLTASFIDEIKEIFRSNLTVYTAHSILVPSGYKKISYKDDISPKVKDQAIAEGIKIEKSFLLKIDRICCLSDATKDFFYKVYEINESKLLKIKNGLKDRYKSIPQIEKKKIREKYNFKEHKSKLILYVGRLDYFKGLSYLIEAFEIILTKNKDYYLIIVGDGDYNPFLKLRNNNWKNIIFTGKLPQEEVYNLYRICDIGILPSLSEQCSFVAIEMMMFQLPIIASNAEGLDEMFVDDDNALKIKIQDDLNEQLSTKEISEKITNLIHDKILMDKISRKARSFYLEQHILSKFKDNILSLYQISKPFYGTMSN